jgi:hypothetical protein
MDFTRRSIHMEQQHAFRREVSKALPLRLVFYNDTPNFERSGFNKWLLTIYFCFKGFL